MLFFILLVAALASGGDAKGLLMVTPRDDLARVSQRLAKDASITEVVLEAGTYGGGWRIPPLTEAGPEPHPLLIRAADGAEVVFDGARPIGAAKPVRGRPGVFATPFAPGETREAPQIFEPEARVRYLLAADLDAVERFPASYIVSDRSIFFHTSDGLPPGARRILESARDFGLLVRRPHVTVRGLHFRNFNARAKWSTAVEMRADHVTVEQCEVANASFGFTLLADDDALVESTARDVGGGVYLAGKRGRVERGRFLKERDRFVVPTYAQDDTGIQAYSPAETGTIRGNLAVGFGTGILIKSSLSPWLVEENTLVAGEEPARYGFIATRWDPGSVFRRNVVAGYDILVEIARDRIGPGVERNCYSGRKSSDPDAKLEEPGAVTGDPRFVDPRAGDYRLGKGSPCLAAAGEGEAVGAPEAVAKIERLASGGAAAGAAVGRERTDVGGAAGAASAPPAAEAEREPRAWHVSPSGRDSASGNTGSPLRSIQEAVDRARAGDTILLHPGIYADPVRFDRGGSEGRPITLRATERWKAILDGARRHDDLIRIEKAPFVVIQDLEVRWYRVAGIHVRASPDVRVEGCRIWNAHRGGTWPEGDGVRVEKSPRFTGVRNVLFNQERGFELLSSPASILSRNTAVGNLYGAVHYIHSIEDAICTNNSFAYQGNDAIAIVESEGGVARLRSSTLDYNNYGLTLIPGSEGESLARIEPRKKDLRLAIESKAIVYYEEEPAPHQRFRTMEAWRRFSSLDAHSIFADPLFVDSAADDFRLERKSPNRGAGESGSTIGAFD